MLMIFGSPDLALDAKPDGDVDHAHDLDERAHRHWPRYERHGRA
jgi:hypothetical protein